VVGGNGGNRTVTVTPVAGRLGSTTITLTVNDGQLTATRSFVVSVIGTPLEVWRLANFGTILPEGPAADDADADADGQDNRAEFAAGTDPNNPADVFRVLSAAFAEGRYRVTFPTKPGRTYSLLRGPAPNGPWTSVATLGPAAGAGEQSLDDPTPPPGSGFYRVSVAVE
jgi:hypothetical protein